MVITLKIESIDSYIIKNHPSSIYELKIVAGKSAITPTNCYFMNDNKSKNVMAFQIKSSFKNNGKVMGKIIETKENNRYEKGKFTININGPLEQCETIMNRGKVSGRISFRVSSHNITSF